MTSYFFIKPIYIKNKKELIIRAIPEDQMAKAINAGWLPWEYYFETHPDECKNVIW